MYLFGSIASYSLLNNKFVIKDVPSRFNNNRPFSYSRQASESNDIFLQFEEFSNMHNND